ncbi:MAG: class I SAM-dependent methyltransferase [Sedimentisphaerales bacterium]|nr:class I SAM-dependent methyltransferase [Sedimentisphaerales bacterium]
MSKHRNLETLFYPEKDFGGFTAADGTVAFYHRVNALLKPDSVVLDVGCGRGAYAEDPVPYRRQMRILRGKCAKVIGIDIDPAAADNPCIDEFRLLDQVWPIESKSVDLILMDSIVEHLTKPAETFAQCFEVLREGGFLCVRTPNLCSYFGLAVRLIPNRCRRHFLKKVQNSRQSRDIFPAVYRCNTHRKIKKTLRQCGFEACIYGHESEPVYLSFAWPAFLLGVLHERLSLRFLGIVLFAFARKPVY